VASIPCRRKQDGNPVMVCESSERGEDVEEQVETEEQTQQQQPGSSSEVVLPWSLEGLRASQRADPDMGFVIPLMESLAEQPAWESVSLSPTDVKVLWKLWPRLSIRDGLLKRRFESLDGKTETWQVVMPKELRS